MGCSIGDPNERIQAFKPDTVFSGNNRIPLPKFSGDGSKDANEFLAIFERIARLYKLNKDRKMEIFILSLTGNASVWFNTTRV